LIQNTYGGSAARLVVVEEFPKNNKEYKEECVPKK
jgi:hypothetical protein